MRGAGTKKRSLKMSKKTSSVKISTSDAAKLAELIQRMQKNADLVERDILRAEALLTQDYVVVQGKEHLICWIWHCSSRIS